MKKLVEMKQSFVFYFIKKINLTITRLLILLHFLQLKIILNKILICDIFL